MSRSLIYDRSKSLLNLGFLLVVPALGIAEVESKYSPVQIGTFTEYGRVVEGSDVEGYGSEGVITKQNMSRISAWVTQEVSINQRLSIAAGISGMFWYSLPETEGLPHTRLVKFATGLQAGSATYSFGDLESPFLKLKMGFFGYKYNPDANNLGEYLFRSGTYPGYLWTGGWTLLNAAGYGANGIQGAFSFLDNSLKLDANLFIERDIEPNFDLSPSVVASYNWRNVFEFGSGVVFSHLIPANSDKVTPKKRENAYYFDPIRKKEMPLPQAQFNKPGYAYFAPGDVRNDSMIVAATDPRYGTILPNSDPRAGKSYVTVEENGVPNSLLSYYTFAGTKVMARASLNLLRLMESDWFSPEDGKIYGEVALLGVKDYPFYYEKKSERMPMMLGINIPTFKILDKLSIEVERYRSPFANSIKTEFGKVYPIWDLPVDAKRGINAPDPATFIDSSMSVKGRNNYWSVYAKKTIVPGLTLFGQVAHDHTRALNYLANPTYQPFIQEDKDWYWAIRLEAGI